MNLNIMFIYIRSVCISPYWQQTEPVRSVSYTNQINWFVPVSRTPRIKLPCQRWPFFNFSVPFSWTCYQNLDQAWKKKLACSFRCLSFEFSRMFFSLVFCKKWPSLIYWTKYLKILRLLLTFLSTMIVMWMLQTYLKGILLL